MNEETKNKQVKKYPKPEEQEAIDKIMDLANQWCELDEQGGRGAMVMLTDDRGTHYMFNGSAEVNTRCAIDIIRACDMKDAGRLVQLTFLQALNFDGFNRAIERLGIADYWGMSEEERQRITVDKPELMAFVRREKRIIDEFESYGKKSN